ncbi:MAG: hypothetical protein U0165_00480 [Polyangiaceae bacterium]
MIVRLDAVDGALDVELTQGDGPAFKVVSPWRVSPLVEVDDFSKVPAQQRAAFARLLDVLPSREAPKETFAPLTQPVYDTSRPQSLPRGSRSLARYSRSSRCRSSRVLARQTPRAHPSGFSPTLGCSPLR